LRRHEENFHSYKLHVLHRLTTTTQGYAKRGKSLTPIVPVATQLHDTVYVFHSRPQLHSKQVFQIHTQSSSFLLLQRPNPLYLATPPNKPPTIHNTHIHHKYRRKPHHGQLKPPRKAVEQPEAQDAAMRASGEKRDPSTTAARLSRGPNSKCDGTSIPQDTRRARHLSGVNPAEGPWPSSGDPAAGFARLAGEGVK
jgi:hypothetical protein